MPIALKKAASSGLIYELPLDQLPTVPGAYIFGRKFGGKVVPIYVGETQNIKSRVKGHLKSLPLMKAIENSPNGPKFFIFCTVKTNAPKRAKQHVKIIERAIILHSQAEGHVLFNTSGAKLPTDEISFVGNRTSEALAPRLMLIKRALLKKPK
jgi:hypothetical protein